MSTPWYDYPTVNNYGSYPDPYGNFPKPDINVNAPYGTAITALEGGTITGINSPSGAAPDFGPVVTVALSDPLNSLATHIAYLHLGSIANGLKVGQTINQGDVIGYAGPNAQGNAGTGLALYSGDYYGFGPEWANVGNSLLNPTALLNSFINGAPMAPNGQPAATGQPGAAAGQPGISIPGLGAITFPNIWQFFGIAQPAATAAIDWKDVGIRTGLVLVAIIIIIIAIAKMIQKPEVVVQEK
jgi:hypothetical protein